VNIGDTFIWCPPGQPREHLWIIISDPNCHNGKFVIINLTDSSHGRYSFTLHIGQHPYISKDSDVNFGDAFSTTISYLMQYITNLSARQREPMDMNIVREIITRARTHPAFHPVLRRLLPPP
jgi:hypothetical protein